MNCFHCQKSTNNSLRSIKTGKRGRPPKGVVCDKCLKTYAYEDEKVLEGKKLIKEDKKTFGPVPQEIKEDVKKKWPKKVCQSCGGGVRGANTICTKCKNAEKSKASEERKLKRERKALRPTEKELRLLAYPPTSETWRCPDPSCIGVMSGSYDQCFICGSEHGDQPKRVWPEYVIACQKVGIDPEDRLPWPRKATKIEAA